MHIENHKKLIVAVVGPGNQRSVRRRCMVANLIAAKLLTCACLILASQVYFKAGVFVTRLVNCSAVLQEDYMRTDPLGDTCRNVRRT